MMAKVPLAEEGSGVTASLEHLGDEYFAVGNTGPRFRPGRSQHIDAIGIAAGEQTGPGGSAYRLGDVPVGEAQARVGHPVEVGSLEAGSSEFPCIGVTLVIGHDDDDVGWGVEGIPGEGGHRRESKSADGKSEEAIRDHGITRDTRE